ncbi:MAG: hypothetical protein J5855_08360 [Mailhella sp.]|nr:hypothetical protein [Mailhella sp.]
MADEKTFTAMRRPLDMPLGIGNLLYDYLKANKPQMSLWNNIFHDQAESKMM